MTHSAGLFLALGASLIAIASTTIVQDCGSKATVNGVKVSGCELPPCLLKRGEDIVVEIDFENLQETTESLTAKVHGNIGGVDIPWFGVDENACNDLTVGDCPVEGNEKIYYSAHVPILSSYPAVAVIVKWQLLTQNNEDAACFLVPAQIV
uniref:Ecdysteroid-regulated protein n=1 Tax=Penaeus vannamei TaxID=6689 RepID=F1AQD0_PENVA|nr:ecdysteroid-regulated protein [Penaeus vannamei]